MALAGACKERIAQKSKKEISREKLAEELNVSISTYYNWLAGRTAIPSTALKKMANIFGANIDYLLTEAITEGEG